MEVRFSKFSIDDLNIKKFQLLEGGDSIRGIVKLSEMINRISEIETSDCEYSKNLDYLYYIYDENIIFLREKNDKLIIDRILDKDSELVKASL